MTSSRRTRLTQLLNIKTPIVSAPMAFVSGGLLATKVTQAGGFGFLSSGYRAPEEFKKQLSIVRSAFKTPHSQPTTLPIGVGFLGWLLDANKFQEVPCLDFALENRPKAVWFAFGTDLGRWIRHVREFDQKCEDGHKTLVFAQINSVSEALTAVDDWKVDVLVAQGHEAGGHGRGSAPPLHILVTAVLSALGDRCPPLIAAGGIACGSQVASVLALGASGALLGTRFALSEESMYSDLLKNTLLSADISSTVRTMALDYAAGTTGWPEGIDGRGIRNELVKTYDRGDGVEEVQRKYREGLEAQDPDRLVIWAGTSVGFVNEIKKAEDIVKEVHQDAVEALNTAQNIVRS